MASCAESPQDFIRSAFGPRVAVVSSPDADEVCQKNNLSFVDMLKPFCRPTQEGQIRDPHYQLHTVKNIVLHITTPQPNLQPSNVTKKILSDTVSSCHMPSDQGATITVGDVRVNATTPWFEAYRRMFFEQSRQSDHEFLLHYVACILVVSSNHPNPVEEFANLYQRHTQIKWANKYPKYMPHSHLFYYRLLIHDVTSGDDQKAQRLQQELSSKYGIGQSSVLKINSRRISSLEDSEQAPETDPWSQYLINTDANQEDNSVESDEDEEPDPSKIYSNPPSLSTSSLKKQTASLPPAPSEPRLDLLADDPLASESISDPLSSDPLSEANDPLTRALQASELGTLSDGSSKHANQADTVPLGIPSRVPSVKVLHGQCLTLIDQERIRAFVNDFCNRGLLPFLDKQIRQLNEQVNSKKGFQRALFRVGRSWFGGGNKPSSNHSGITNYSIESGELQMRLLGDLAFLCQNYELAYTCYHSCKRDFQNDHAWLYYAGALEMAATSLFMQPSNRRDPHPYFEESIQVYADTCKLSHYATRATLLATEMMKTKSLYRPAAATFIKITSEDSDLKSALMLEQAAHCFLRMNPQSIRKFAFHLILAGHRYSKSFQRKHALRTYGQALEFYQEKSWSLAEDHINFSLGHQSFTLKQLEDAYVAFHRLLSHSWSLQQPKQQNTHLKEFLYVFKQHLISIGLGSASATTEISDGPTPFLSSVEATADLPVLPLPAVVAQQTRVLISCVAGYHEQLLPDNLGGFRHFSLGNEEQDNEEGLVTKAGLSSFDRLDSSLSMDKWRRLEQIAMNGSSNSNPSVEFVSCLQNYFDENTDNSTEPACVVGERVDVQLSLQNPLQVDLCLGKLTLLWEHNVPDGSMSHETPPSSVSPSVVTEVLDELTIAAGSMEQLQLSLTPLFVGTVSIVGFAYNLKARSNEHDSNENDEDDVGLLQRRDRKSNVKRMLNVGVRGKQLVHCRGVRMNRDNKEKSSVVYGTDKRLHLRVIPAMPQLEVTFVNFPNSLLCGEVKLVETKFSNRGKKPLKNVRITSSHNQCFSFGGLVKDCRSNTSVKTSGESSEDKTSVTDSEPRGHSVALRVPAVTSIQLPNNQLNEGDSVAVPMWVHGGEEPGVQEINFLFYYEPVDSDSHLRHRALRHTARISLASSLRLTASAELSLKNTHECSRIDKTIQELLLTLDVDNIVQVSKERTASFELRQMSCMSWQWKIYPLVPQQPPGYILPKETHMLKFRATYSNHDVSTDGLFTSQVGLSQQLLEIDSYSSPYVDFFLRSSAAFSLGLPICGRDMMRNSEDGTDGNARSKHTAVSSDVYDPTVDTNDARHQYQLGSDAALGLILLWKGVVTDGDRSHHVFGQSHAAVLELQGHEQLDVAASLADDRLLVRASLNHPSFVRHKFGDKRICQLPVEIVVQNTSRDAVEVEVHLLSPNTSPKGVDQTTPTPATVHHRSFCWVGSIRRHCRLAAHSSCSLKASVCLTCPGLYSLSRLRLRARKLGKESEFVVQTCVPVSVVTVTSDSGHIECSAV